MTETLKNFIDGRFVDAGGDETSPIVNPATGEEYARAPISTDADVEAACKAAARAFESWRDSTPAERGLALLKIAAAFEDHAQELVDIEVANTGKPTHLAVTDEVPPSVDTIRFFAGAARVLEGRSAGEYMAGHTSYVRREPIGVCAQVTPWNYPLMMAVWKWAPAIAAGNTVVLKPSDTTPMSTVKMAEIMAEFLPPGVFNVICGDRSTGAALVTHDIPQMASITGSVRAGKEVATAAAKDLKKVHLELGGKAPVIVFDDADLESTAELIADAGYYNAGQDCTAATRVLASSKIHDDLVSALGQQAKSHPTGHPSDENTYFGPVN
ncbi:MAG: aldehyde dehydrogenase family protein, partial [Actinobacteria bacterium]|nr:aldehyde dehydrogenase family protein [Actinomycetota bacterium]